MRLPRACLSVVLAATAALSGAAALAQPIAFNGNGSAFSLPVKPQKAAAFEATVKQQFDFSCGSAALATLLTFHYGAPTSEQIAFAAMLEQGDAEKIRVEGFSMLDMKRYLATLGFESDGFEQPLESLLEARIPAIVLVTDNGYNHFVVVKGLRDGRVLLGDPSSGVRLMSRERFESVWKNRVLFVIHNRQDVASFNTAIDWQGAPLAPMSEGVVRATLQSITIPRLGPGEF